MKHDNYSFSNVNFEHIECVQIVSIPALPVKALLEYIPDLCNNQGIFIQNPLIFLELCATLMTRNQFDLFCLNGHLVITLRGGANLASKRNTANPTEEDRSWRQERADRILDATAELILRWGYRKTTIDDIARQARVAKGTIYLHWKTREDLFMALITREALKLVEDMKRRIASDPEGSTLRGFVKHSTHALLQNSLMKALYLNDTDMLGEFASREYSSATYPQRIENYKNYLEFLRSHGLVSTDIGIREQTYIFSAVWIGFLLVDPWMPEEFKVSDEEMVELLADTVQRALEPRNTDTGTRKDSGSLQEVSEALNLYVDQEVEAIKIMQKEMES
jgi:AcrR family transcriptional regulator